MLEIPPDVHFNIEELRFNKRGHVILPHETPRQHLSRRTRAGNAAKKARLEALAAKEAEQNAEETESIKKALSGFPIPSIVLPSLNTQSSALQSQSPPPLPPLTPPLLPRVLFDEHNSTNPLHSQPVAKSPFNHPEVSELSTLREEITVLKAALEASLDSNQRCQQAFQDLQAEVATLRTALAEERLQRESHPIQSTTLQTENQDLRRIKFNLERTVLDLEQQRDSLQLQLDAAVLDPAAGQSTAEPAESISTDALTSRLEVQVGPSLEATLEPIVQRVLDSLLGKGDNEPTSPSPSIPHSQPTDTTSSSQTNGQAQERKPKKKKKKSKKKNNSTKGSQIIGDASTSTQAPSAPSGPLFSKVVQSGPRSFLPLQNPSQNHLPPPPPLPRQLPRQLSGLRPPTFSESSLLAVPTNSSERALQIIRGLPDVNPISLGVRHHVEFPNGGVLIRCDKKENALRLRSILEGTSGLELRDKRVIVPEIRLHNVPGEVSVDQINATLSRILGEPPSAIRLVDYSNPVVPGTKLAVISVTPTAYEVAKTRRTIRLGWASCPLKTLPYISRCTNCHLLGHKANACRNQSATPDSQVTTPAPNTCIDCCSFNSGITRAGLPKSRLRRTDHASGSQHCLSRIALIRRRLPYASQSQPAHAISTGTHRSSEGARSYTNHGRTT